MAYSRREFFEAFLGRGKERTSPADTPIGQSPSAPVLDQFIYDRRQFLVSLAATLGNASPLGQALQVNGELFNLLTHSALGKAKIEKLLRTYVTMEECNQFVSSVPYDIGHAITNHMQGKHGTDDIMSMPITLPDITAQHRFLDIPEVMDGHEALVDRAMGRGIHWHVITEELGHLLDQSFTHDNLLRWVRAGHAIEDTMVAIRQVLTEHRDEVLQLLDGGSINASDAGFFRKILDQPAVAPEWPMSRAEEERFIRDLTEPYFNSLSKAEHGSDQSHGSEQTLKEDKKNRQQDEPVNLTSDSREAHDATKRGGPCEDTWRERAWAEYIEESSRDPRGYTKK